VQRIVDRTGFMWAELAWRDDELQEFRVPGAIIHRVTLHHPLLGAAAPISTPDGTPLTVISAVDWARPIRIPAIAAPAKLPPGAGGVILNVLALLAERAGVRAVRYAGPYPTAALYHSLLRSFRTTATEAAFTAGSLTRTTGLDRDELPFDFVPAPHERVAIPHGHVELRDGLERAVLDGIAYVRDGAGSTRLVDHRAEVWFGDTVYAHVATFATDGTLVDGPHPPPTCTSPVVGREFPPALRAALAELVADAVPAPLAADARAFVAAQPLHWADLGARTARFDAAGLHVHAALWDRIAPLGLARLALALAEALAPLVASTIVAQVE
jgi:hypothetical protein